MTSVLLDMFWYLGFLCSALALLGGLALVLDCAFDLRRAARRLLERLSRERPAGIDRERHGH